MNNLYIHDEAIHNKKAASVIIPLIHEILSFDSVLDVGCGSGYLCAAFYEMTKNPNSQGRTSVVGIEHIEPLA